jgi:hypothetical protein
MGEPAALAAEVLYNQPAPFSSWSVMNPVIVFALSEVLISGLVGVETALAAAAGVP